MGMDKHTPGPWVHYEGSNSIWSESGTAVCVLCGPRDDVKTRQNANARLIAAAPEMFEALNVAWELIINLGRPETNDRHHAACEKIRTALSKATGEQ